MIDYRDSTRTLPDRDPNSTATITPYPDCYYTTTYTATVEPTKDEKAEAVKKEAEEKRVKKMRELWKMERQGNRGRAKFK